jgi:inosine/xanthosine triphosphate pyrophosphatase family protein
MTRVVFVTPNQGRQAEVRRLLADVELEMSRLGPAVPDGLDLEASARVRAAGAFAQLGRPCFVENTGFELEGEPLVRGAALKERLAALGEDGFCQAYAGRRCVAHVVVALAEAPGVAGVRVFLGELAGVVADAPRGDGGQGWDRVFVPDGYERTLAELGASKYLINMRHAPYLDLADHLRGRSFGGAFEAHVTVRLADAAADAPRFRHACDALGVKCVMIELPEGEHAAQPMTASVHRGGLREVQDEVHALARALVGDGFEVVRTKIEALARNADIPETDEQAARSPAGYFEYHLKLLVPGAGQDGHELALARVTAACAPHGARLSKNANKRRPDGSEERFVTLRVPGEGRVHAEARLDALADALAPLGVLQRGRIREYTVYDSNVALDRGWI